MSVVIQELGYLEYAYLEEAYLSGVVTQADGIQFRAVINDFEAKRGVQWQQRIDDKERVSGVQWKQRVDSTLTRGFQFIASKSWSMYQCGPSYLTEHPYLEEAPYLTPFICATGGMQFRGLNNGGLNTQAVQWRQRIDKEVFVGVQFLGRITQDVVRGFQFEAINFDSNKTGVQFRGLNDGGLFASGVQFRGLNADVDRPVGVQWQQRIDKDVVSGFQFDARNNGGLRASGFEFRASRSWAMYRCERGYLVEYPYLEGEPYLASSICATGGLQFAARNDVSVNNAIQWQQRIDQNKIIGVQWRQLIGKDVYKGFQFTAIKSVNVGAQFRVVIYNTTNLRILYQFPSRGTSGTNWTANSTESSSTNAFSENNVNTDIVEQVWRSGPTTNALLTCDTQVPQGVFVDTLAILNHNFGGNTDVRLERSTNGITWSTEANLIVERVNMYYVAPSLPLSSYRYWRLVLTDTSLGFFQIGTIVFGSSTIFQGECFVDSVRFGKKQYADKVFTEGHTNVSNDRGRKSYMGLEFKNLNFGKANFRQLRQVFDDAGTLLKALWIPTPQTPSRFAVFGKLEELPEETHNTKGEDYVDLSVKVDESL